MPTQTGSEGLFTEKPIASKGTVFSVHRYLLKDEASSERDEAQPVLLVHAATLGRKMFIEPKGGFVQYLLRTGSPGARRFDVYTLDWRSSNQLFGNWAEGGAGLGHDDYRLDRVAEVDIPGGVRAVAAVRPGREIHVVAHCIGAAATAQALATRSIGEPGDPPVGHVVLSTLGLFFRQGIDGTLKTSENIMRDLETAYPNDLGVSPHVAFPKNDQRWNELLEPMFETWRKSVFPHRCPLEFCKRIWFLFGGDYRVDDMKAMHDPAVLAKHFGALPVGLCRQLIENCERGWAAPFRAGTDRSYLTAEVFRGRHLTLITGAENQVWHRDSIDLMHEWLHRSLGQGAQQIEKRVFDNYGHVDLWWSSNADKDGQVFDYVRGRL